MTRNQEIEKAIAELAEHGRVAVVESGRVYIIRARLSDFLKMEIQLAESAFGHFNLGLERPSIARRAPCIK